MSEESSYERLKQMVKKGSEDSSAALGSLSAYQQNLGSLYQTAMKATGGALGVELGQEALARAEKYQTKAIEHGDEAAVSKHAIRRGYQNLRSNHYKKKALSEKPRLKRFEAELGQYGINVDENFNPKASAPKAPAVKWLKPVGGGAKTPHYLVYDEPNSKWVYKKIEVV